MSKTLLLIDDTATLNACRELGLITPSAQIIAVTKYGLAACAEARVVCKIIDDFYPREALIQWSLNQYLRLEAFCEAQDRRLSTLSPELFARGLQPFRDSFYELKILIDVVSTKVFQLLMLVNSESPDKIVYRECEIPPCTDDRLWFEETANLFASALKCVQDSGLLRAQLQGIQVRGTTMKVTRYKKRSIKHLIHTFRSRIGRWVASLHPGPRSYLLFYDGHDLQDTEPTLRASGLSPRRLAARSSADAALSSRSQQVWQALQEDPGFKEFFTVKEILYFPIVAARLEHFISRVIPKMVSAYDDATKELRHMDPKPEFMISAAVTLGAVERARMKAGQDALLPLIGYQEGAGFGSVEHPMNDFAELGYGDVFLCYGEGNFAYHKRLQARGRSVKPFLVVGSAEQDRVSSRRKPRENTATPGAIMYVGNCVAANLQHQPYNGFTDTVYHHSQRAIFSALEHVPANIEVQIKPHPADALTYRYFSQKRARPFTVLSEPLEECLQATDLFIVDFPSTTLLSCCTTDADIFVLTEPGVTKLESESKTALQKRAFIFEDHSSLLEALKQYSSGHPVEKRRSDDYLRQYGNYLADGHSADRAARAMTEFRLASHENQSLRSGAL